MFSILSLPAADELLVVLMELRFPHGSAGTKYLKQTPNCGMFPRSPSNSTAHSSRYLWSIRSTRLRGAGTRGPRTPLTRGQPSPSRREQRSAPRLPAESSPLTALTVAARPRALCSPPEARGAALPLKGAVGKGRERRPVGAAARGGAGAPPGGLSCCTHGGTQ